MRLGRLNRDIVAPLAGMFLLLPAVAADHFMTQAPALKEGATSAEQISHFSAYAMANWHVLLIHGLVTSFGALTILALLLRQEGPTVAQALRMALFVLPVYFVANILQSAIVVTGFFFFILPGLYLIGRLVLISPATACERPTNPLEPIQRSFALTRGQGWRIVALLGIVFCVGMILGVILTTLAGIVLSALLPMEAAGVAMSLVSGLFEAIFALAFILLSAALYQELAR